MDEADQAQVSTERLLNAGIAACRGKANQGETLSDEGIDCEEVIPKDRRTAVPGCLRCIECQVEFEDNK